MNIAILDSGKTNRVVNTLKSMHMKNGLGMNIYFCNSAMEVLTTAAGTDFDIVIFEEELSDNAMDGYDLAYRLKIINERTMPVIIAEKCEIDIKAGRSELFGYIKQEDIEATLPELVQYAAKRHPRAAKTVLAYRYRGKEKTVEIDKILYLYSAARVVNYKSTEGESGAFYQRLDEVERILFRNGVKFERISKSFLVNPQYILIRRRQEVIMDNGDRLPVSRKYQ